MDYEETFIYYMYMLHIIFILHYFILCITEISLPGKMVNLVTNASVCVFSQYTLTQEIKPHLNTTYNLPKSHFCVGT
jgi:hypothetical protein